MRKFFLSVTFAFVFLITGYFVHCTTHAQDFTAQKAFEDYQYQLTIYQKAEADYQDAKTFYQKNPTLQLREVARQKTLGMLRTRDILQSTYITALRMEFTETTGLTNEEKAGLFGKLDSEVEWYQKHMESYQDDMELSTLFTKSDESKVRYEKTTKFIIYETLFNISLSQLVGLRLDHQLVYADLKNFLNDKVAEGKLRIDPFNRWLNDTDTVLVALAQNEVSAKKKMSTLYSQAFSATQTYNASVKIMNTSINPTYQLNKYLTELLTSIESQLQ